MVVLALAMSVAANIYQLTTSHPNTWVNVVWPRLQGGLLLAAMSRNTLTRIALIVTPPAIASWVYVSTTGLTPFTEAMVEVTVFLAIAILASKQCNPYLRWALLIYSLPTVILSPALANLASQQNWRAWIPLFEVVHVGRILGLTGIGVWLWRSTRAEQLELKLT